MVKLLTINLMIFFISSCGTHKPLLSQVCPLVEYEICEELDEPIVVISNVVNIAYPTTYGFMFAGEPYLFVNPLAPWPKQRDTIFHETVHYVHAANNIPASCEAEREARNIAHQLSEYPKLEGWERMYSFCNEE